MATILSRLASLRLRSTRTLTALLITLAVGLSGLVPALLTSGSHAAATSSRVPGLWLVGSDGGVFSYGAASFDGSTAERSLNKPIAGMSATPNGEGYWLAASDGGVFSFGDATFYGSTGRLHLNRPIVAVTATPDGKGYWLAASDGGIFSFGDAGFYGSTGGWHLNQPIAAMATTPDGKGYWEAASDGGIFNYGDAGFYGSAAGMALGSPITSMAATPNGKGYWLVAADGSVYAFGDAAYYGGGVGPNMSVVAMAATSDGLGYWLVTSNGAVVPFGDAAPLGTTAGMSLNKPVVGAAAISMLTSNAALPTTTTTQPSATTTTRPAATTTTTRPPSTTTTTRPPTTTTTQPPTTTTTVPPTTTTTTPSSSGQMAAPAGYSAGDMVLDDQFANLDNWNTYYGPGTPWQNRGALPSPYSGGNQPNSNDMAFYSPTQDVLMSGGGVSLNATPSSQFSSQGYSWESGVLTSKNPLPSGGWYVQVKAQMPDTSAGFWPAIWALPSSSAQELDGFEGGWPGSSPNEQGHSDTFASSGQIQQVWATPGGANVSSGYNTYGFQYIPGTGMRFYFNGTQVYSSSANLSTEDYYLFLQLQVASAQTSGWHTTGGSTPGSMKIAEVQVYS